MAFTAPPGLASGAGGGGRRGPQVRPCERVDVPPLVAERTKPGPSIAAPADRGVSPVNRGSESLARCSDRSRSVSRPETVRGPRAAQTPGGANKSVPPGRNGFAPDKSTPTHISAPEPSSPPRSERLGRRESLCLPSNRAPLADGPARRAGVGVGGWVGGGGWCGGWEPCWTPGWTRPFDDVSRSGGDYLAAATRLQDHRHRCPPRSPSTGPRLFYRFRRPQTVAQGQSCHVGAPALATILLRADQRRDHSRPCTCSTPPLPPRGHYDLPNPASTPTAACHQARHKPCLLPGIARPRVHLRSR